MNAYRRFRAKYGRIFSFSSADFRPRDVSNANTLFFAWCIPTKDMWCIYNERQSMVSFNIIICTGKEKSGILYIYIL